ncbi:GTP cyclohydrolase II [Vibrio sp. Of7-15]|uniref:GTP cyclohydrolase II n=1 Tax=Vibrio sp. Of7-15 TaxID=2724879 RepID=UPI001EF1C21D|nr:GTP cyclohydrolase II [Vibrio sp. Of7-15]MCG7499540.1 GTP cyclohydrolase II [Vibrio sp. Of7-15]
MYKEVFFYEPEDLHGYLSNFAPVEVNLEGQIWATSEHYYQAQKFHCPELQEKIRNAKTPDIAFQLSREYVSDVREDWEDIRSEVMKLIVSEKFKQNPQIADKLISTGNCIIKEHSHKDNFWGDGGDGSGRNELGKILMDVRDELVRERSSNTVQFVEKAKLPTQWGTFMMHGFYEPDTGKEHLALVYGDLEPDTPILIRLHSECLTGDALFSARCDCGFQLSKALENIVENGSGVLLYLRQEGRGIGLLNKIKAYNLQDDGADTVEANEALGFEADMRKYDFCRGMLNFLDIKQVRLMTNNPRKVKALKDVGIEVVERVALKEGKNPHNVGYLNTKATKLGHMFVPYDVNKA